MAVAMLADKDTVRIIGHSFLFRLWQHHLASDMYEPFSQYLRVNRNYEVAADGLPGRRFTELPDLYHHSITPDILVIDLGYNDLDSRDPATGKAISPKKMAEIAVNILLCRMPQYRPKATIVCIPSIVYKKPRFYEDAEGINHAIRQYAWYLEKFLENSHNIELYEHEMPAHGAWTVEEGDGLHPAGNDGLNKYKNSIRRAIFRGRKLLTKLGY